MKIPFLFCGILLFASSTHAQEMDLLERTSRGGHFSVWGYDYDAVQFVGQLSDEMEAVAECYFEIPTEQFSAIVVKLVPADWVSFSGPFAMRLQLDGELTVLIRWDRATEFRAVCQALASACLQSIAFLEYGPRHARAVPDWLEMAFAGLLETKVRPAMVDVFVEEGFAEPAFDLKQILEAKGPYRSLQGLYLDNNAYWLFEFLERQAVSKANFKSFLLGCLVSSEPMAWLMKSYPQHCSTLEACQQWWEVGRNELLQAREPPFYSMERSRKLVLRLSHVAYRDGEEKFHLSGFELWKCHNTPACQEALAERIRQIKRELQRINPLYFNALLAVGRCYEDVLADNEELFFEDRASFDEQFSQSEQMQAAITKLLESSKSSQ